MLGGAVQDEAATVWGIPVPTGAGGRRKWPDEIRAMAVERINAGAGIRETAEAIGAHKSLVSLRVKQAKPTSADVADAVPAFIEIVPPPQGSRIPPSAPTPSSSDTSCRIRIGDAKIAAHRHLAGILRAVRAVP